MALSGVCSVGLQTMQLFVAILWTTTFSGWLKGVMAEIVRKG